jgi:hypothetical protein
MKKPGNPELSTPKPGLDGKGPFIIIMMRRA